MTSNDTKLLIAEVLLVLSLMTFSFTLGTLVEKRKLVMGFESMGPTDSTSCNSLSLIETSKCLVSNFTSWYHYNLSNVGKPLTEYELKSQGGVCEQASKWYVSQFQERGFNGDTTIFYGPNNTAHMIAIVYDKNLSSYCVIDQTRLVGCAYLKNPWENKT